MSEKTPGRLMGIPKDIIDPVVEDRIKATIEQLEEHVAPTFASYESLIKRELEWIEHERHIRKALGHPLP